MQMSMLLLVKPLNAIKKETITSCLSIGALVIDMVISRLR